MSPTYKFIISIAISLIIAFTLHLFLLNLKSLSLFDNLIIEAYIINFLMAVGIYMGLYHFKKKYNDLLGFLYLGGSFLKFIVFFIVFYPAYKLDGEMDSLEFAAFFVPYSISLFIETFGVINFLKK